LPVAWEGAAARGIAACLVSFGFAAGVRADHCPVLPELGGPLISGTTAYVSGTHAWTDYAYDDRGENSNAIPGGDATYPADPHPGNTADLIQLQVGTNQGGVLVVLALVETLVPGADVAVGVGFDTDRNSLTGAPAVPAGSGRRFRARHSGSSTSW